MNRTTFLKGVLGASIFMGMDGFSSIVNGLAHNRKDADKTTDSDGTVPDELASFGAIHLNNTSLEKATQFWTNIVGMKLRSSNEKTAEFGTETRTLVVVNATAMTPFAAGYSGLYHFAIHAPNHTEFARMLSRLIEQQYPCSPVDHTMTKSVYLEDPDGITVEFALETPERFKRVITQGGLRMEDTDGTIRSATAPLDVEEVLSHLTDKNTTAVLHEDSVIGHIHYYAANVDQSFDFYKKIGFLEFNYLPEFLYADLGAGGLYQHRIAMNSWHGKNRPEAPAGTAGLQRFQINYNSKESLEKVLENVSNYTKTEEGYTLKDPSGNKLLLTHL